MVEIESFEEKLDLAVSSLTGISGEASQTRSIIREEGQRTRLGLWLGAVGLFVIMLAAFGGFLNPLTWGLK